MGSWLAIPPTSKERTAGWFMCANQSGYQEDNAETLAAIFGPF
jgi:hypothetical protein